MSVYLQRVTEMFCIKRHAKPDKGEKGGRVHELTLPFLQLNFTSLSFTVLTICVLAVYVS